MTKVSFGLLGVTHPHASGRLRALERSGRVAIVGGADDSALGTKFFSHFGIKQKSNSEILTDPEIDAVLVCGESSKMTASSIRALKAGKHVWVEKPGGQTVQDLQALTDAVHETRKICQIGFGKRAAPAVVKASEAIASGVLGRVVVTRFHAGCPSFETASKFANAPGEMGGTFWIIGSHIVDITLNTFGMPDAVNARALKFSDLKSTSLHEDAVSATLIYQDHIVCIDFNCWDALPNNESWRMSVYGTNGEMHLRFLPTQLEMILNEAAGGHPAGPSVPLEIDYVRWAGARTDYSPEIPEVANTEQFEREVAAFLSSMTGDHNNMAKAQDALNIARVIQACYASSDQGGTQVAL